MNTNIHHGDVSLWAGKLPAQAKLVQRQGPAVLALGEQTGHRHELAMAEVYEVNGVTWVVVPETTTLAHLGGEGPDHDTVVVPAGTYRVNLTREYKRGQVVRDLD